MCMFAICFSNFVPFFFPKIISFCFEACVSAPFAGAYWIAIFVFNNQPKLWISHNLIPFHPKQETPKDSGNPRGGAEVALRIYKNFLIYRTCMRRAPAKPVLACTLRKLCPVSHVPCEAPLRTSHSTLHFSHCTLRTPHFTLHTSHSTLHSSHSKLHTSHSTLHTSQSTLLTCHCFLHTPHFTLHTPHCTLHSSRPTLDTALFTLHASSHLSSSHLILAHLFSSHLFSSHPNSITHAAAARSNLNAAITMRSAETELQNAIILRATASEIAAPKRDLDAKAKKSRFCSTFYKDF